jgi:hypothetical protein
MFKEEVDLELFLDAVRETNTALSNEILEKEMNLGQEARATVEANAAPYEANFEAGMSTQLCRPSRQRLKRPSLLWIQACP